MYRDKGVSVIICCYNSATRIIDTLSRLACQVVSPTIKWEVVLVDNASTDDTVASATRFWQHSSVNVSLVVATEKMAGLSYARRKGIETAKYEFLLFCDDDNWLEENYVADVYDIMCGRSEIGALGGNGVPKFEVEPPKFVVELAGTYATGPQGLGTQEVQSHHVYGAGCTYRRSALIKLLEKGFVYHLTGRKGSVLLAGDDHELCYALYLSGYEIWYSDRLVFYHFIPTSRMTFDYIKNNVAGFANSKFILTIYKSLISNANNKRSKFKNSWSWILLLKALFFVKENGKDLLYFKSNDKLKNVLVRSEIYALKDFFLRRKEYYKLSREISASKWVSDTFKSDVQNI